MTNKYRSSVILALLGCGCAAALPASVKTRPAFTQFDPTGTWVVPGPAVLGKDQPVSVTLSLEPGHQTFDADIAGTGFIKGVALVDGDWMYTLASYNLAHTTLHVYTVGADQMDGLVAHKHLGYQHAVRKDKAPGDPVAGNWKVHGINGDGSNYDAELIVTKLGDHYGLTSIDAGGSKHEGVAFLAGDKLVACTVTSVKVRTTRTLVAAGAGLAVNESTKITENSADFVVGAFHNEAGILRGSSLYGSNEEGQKNREQETLSAAEWSHGAAAAAPAAPGAPAMEAKP